MKGKGYQIIAAMLLLLAFGVIVIVLSSTANSAYIERTWDRNETRIEDMSRERTLDEETCAAASEDEEIVVEISEPIVKTEEPKIEEAIIEELKVEEVSKYSAITVTEADYELLAKIVYLEARGESAEGQQAVVEVIFNRVLDTRFPDTIEGVIYAPGQFCTVPMLDSAYPSEMQYAAIDAAMCSDGIVGDAIYFATRPLTKNCVRQIGCHYFCQ